MWQRVGHAASYVLGNEWSDPQVRTDVQDHVSRFTKKLDRLAKSSREDGRRHRAMLNDALESQSAKFCSVMLGTKQKHGHLTYADARRMADELGPRRDCGEPVCQRLVTKGDGGLRTVFAYGLQRTSLQFLVRFALEATLEPNPFDFSRRGLGAPLAIERMLQLIGKEERPWVYTSDIRSCFSNIRRSEWLIRELGIPRSVVDHVIFNPIHDPLLPESVQAALRVLPMGALTSNLVASIVLRHVCEGIADKAVLAYADNFAAACANKVEADAIHNALQHKLNTHPAGPLELHQVRIRHVRKGSHWLGYHLKYDDRTGTVRSTPTEAAFVRFVERLLTKLQLAKFGQLDNIAEREAGQWEASMKAWTPLKPATELTYSDLEELALDFALQEKVRRTTPGKIATSGLNKPGLGFVEYIIPE